MSLSGALRTAGRCAPSLVVGVYGLARTRMAGLWWGHAALAPRACTIGTTAGVAVGYCCDVYTSRVFYA